MRNKIEYCFVVWSPAKKDEINKLERIQKHLISKSEGMEQMDNHERVKEL